MIETILRGTTPLVRWEFKTIDVSRIVTAILVIKQGDPIVTKELSDGNVGNNYIEWILSQEDTLALSDDKPCKVYLDWLLADGTRGAGVTKLYNVGNPAVNEVIE